MPFARPDLQTLVERAQADMRSRLPDTRPALRRSLTGIIARMEAGVAHGLYGYLDWLALQLMPDTASVEYLERWASIWGQYRKAAGYAEGPLTVNGTEGAAIPEGTLFQRADGTRYAAVEEALVGEEGSAEVAVQALEAGIDGNAPKDTELSLMAPLAGIKSDAVAKEGLSGGVAEESDAALRRRLLMFIQRTPMGGALHDYETWALEVPGVTRAFITAGEMGRGTVTVRFMMDDTYENGIPLEGDRKAVLDYIEERRPVTADVFVELPIADPLNMKIAITPDRASVRNAVTAQINATIKRDAVPGGTVMLSRLNEAVSIAEGEEDHVILEPADNVTTKTGHIVVPGKITWETV